jgi:hypothetical protein
MRYWAHPFFIAQETGQGVLDLQERGKPSIECGSLSGFGFENPIEGRFGLIADFCCDLVNRDGFCFQDFTCPAYAPVGEVC